MGVGCQRTARAIRSAIGRGVLLGLLAFAPACSDGEVVQGDTGSVESVRRESTLDDQLAGSCGYQLTLGTYSTWPGGYQGYGLLKNVSGATATEFEVLVDVGSTSIVNGYQAEYEEVEYGYSVTEPSWLKYQKIPQGNTYQFGFIGSGNFDGLTGYVISINGDACDSELPEVSLSVSDDFFTSDDTLTLTAEASDNVAVRRVVFEQDGEVIAVDSEAPYTLDVHVTEALNGRHVYTATAVDPSNNESSASERVLVAIGNQFFGTAPGGQEDYTYLLDHFDQLTPENAGKWGSVESERDVMNWGDLDEAYDFAQDNDLHFKLHTLLWGQQQPGWIAGLSPEEQLEELDEWMAELAAKYPDVDTVDVVNEPMHAPPSYSEALGGAGDTGYDWVITAFEMAREHFPGAELLLNDYHVVILENFTNDYLGIIELLQERDLIDGIGIQGHFLERAEVSVVSANLEALAATGLPIYVSEFDVSFVDDARQANVARDLFQVFWDHPSVLGVTLWGHQKGSMFQQDAFLIDDDGSTRPALDFMDCYVAGGGESCTVPEYVPPGWQGNEYGVTLEGELYDEGHGVAALGVLAYTDPGDWVRYIGVEFQETWDSFWVTYAKGNQDVGSISVHLDSLDNDPILTQELDPTDGWGSNETLEVAMEPVSGTHDVFVRFNDVYGVANVDSFRFGTPPPEGENLIVDGSFESGIGELWESWNGSLRDVSTDNAYSGEQSMTVTNLPTEEGDYGYPGYVAYDLSTLVAPGNSYEVSMQVMISGPGTARMSAVVSCADGSAAYPWLDATHSALPVGEWTELSGNLKVDCTAINQVKVYLENTHPDAAPVFIDDFAVIAPPETGTSDYPGNLVMDGGFEQGGDSWGGWGTGTRMVTDALAHSGSQSLLVTGRGDANAAIDLADQLTPGQTYTASMWVTVGGEGVASGRLNTTYTVNCGDGDIYGPWLANQEAIPAGTWVQLWGTFTIDPDCTATKFEYYVQGDPDFDFYVDDVIVVANHVQDGGFEAAALGPVPGGSYFYGWSGDRSIVDSVAYEGMQSLLVDSPEGSSGNVAVNLASNIVPGVTYTLTSRVRIQGAGAQVNIARVIDCGSGEEWQPWVASSKSVPNDGWQELRGTFTIPPSCESLGKMQMHFESGDASDFLVDSLIVGP